MGAYDRLISTAKRLIAAKGQSIVWRQLIDGAPVDPAQPWKPTSPATPTDNAVSIVFLPTNRVNDQLIRALANAPEVVTGDVYGLMGAVNFVPNKKDIVIRDGVELRIQYIDPLAPNGDIVLYTIGFTK